MNKKTKKHAHLEATQNVSETVQTILDHNLEYLIAWEDTARSWEDIEGVHQTRVSFRRMRSALTTFRMVIPKSATKVWADQMRDLAGRLGKARDLDVFIDEALGGIGDKLPLPGGKRLTAIAQQHRAAAYRDVCDMFDSEAYIAFKRQFGEWVASRAWEQAELSGKQHKMLADDLPPFARTVLDKQERKVLKAGAHVDKMSAEQMHRLRIECKKLRYAAEFFSPVFAGMEEFIGHMKGLQDLLGIMNDVAVMRHLFEEMLAGVEDPEVLQYAGGIVGWRICQYHQLLEGFEQLWEEFVEAKHPWWKKSALAGHSQKDAE